MAATLHDILQDSRWPVHWHTGIITASERERVEDAMKNDRFGICVATATLEVGIDIGDLDIIILLDPPYSINGFLQRIGRGNRQTDICKVIALYATEQELNLFRALHHCAAIGTLDEIHEYDRAAVRFQQIVSFAWLGAEQDRPLTRKNLAARTCDPNHGPVVEDMLETGALEEIQGALLLSRELTDQAERRQIHTTISGAATLNMVDSSSGETIISASGQGITEGSLFVGGKIKNVTANVDGSVFLEATRGRRYSLSSLPATRGKRGMGRRIIWALAEVAGEDPRVWQQEGSRLITWAGADYNRLLTIFLQMEGITSHAQPDEYGIDGIPDGADISPAQILEWAESIKDTGNLPGKDISQFCERSRYFSQLSSEMQETEAQRSVPFSGFIQWLQECMAMIEEDTVLQPDISA
jgi:ATP-dependent Lhr-like helicase